MGRSCVVALLGWALPCVLWANPSGSSVRAGQASFAHSDSNTLTVYTSDQAVIHWDSFSITRGETTRFVMPSAASSVLNRVVGGNLSAIHGALEANGKVFLINPKGILVGEHARINTASFFASTLDVLDADFLKAEEIAFVGNSRNAVVNLGTISAWDGDIALIATHVENRGALEAKSGVAALAAGTNVLLSPQSNQRILIRACSLDLQMEEVGIDNSGQICALQAELKAEGHPYQFAIRDSGHIDALAVAERGGHLYLVAEEGYVEAKGTYVATHSNGQGGKVHLLGRNIDVDGCIDVSGSRGGGIVLVGGDYQGSNPDIPNAQVTVISKTTRIRADAIDEGNGGKVIVWGDLATGFAGDISARGGCWSGDGGFVEVSSPGHLAFSGLVNTSASFGRAGTLLLDPCTVTISTAATSPVSCPYASFSGTSVSNINNVDLQNCLASNSVTINATATGSALVPGSITVTAPITWNSDNKLVLTAQESGGVIQINDVITAPTSFDPAGTFLSLVGGTVNIGMQNKSLNTPCGVACGDSGTLLIQSSSGNDVNIYGGTSIAPIEAPAFISTQGATIEIQSARDFNMIGGDGDSMLFADVPANAEIVMGNSGSAHLNITANRDMLIQGGTDPGGVVAFGHGVVGVDFVGTGGSPKGSVSISCENLTLEGVSGSTSFSFVQIAASDQLEINASNGVDLVGTIADSYVTVFLDKSSTSSLLSLTCTGGDLNIDAGKSITGIAAALEGNISIDMQQGSVDLNAGTSTDAVAVIGLGEAPFVLGTGNISVTASDMSFNGGSGSNAFSGVFVGGAGNITLNSGGDIFLNGGSGSGTLAAIETLNGNIQVHAQGSVNLNAGNGVGAAAAIGLGTPLTPLGTGDISVTAAFGLNLTGGSAAGAFAGIFAGMAGSVTLGSERDISLAGGSGSDAAAVISTVSGGIRIDAGGLSLRGGFGPDARAEIVTDQGPIKAFVLGNTAMTAGNVAGTHAWMHSTTQGAIVLGSHDLIVTGGGTSTSAGIFTPMGNITTLCTGDCIYTAGLVAGPALMQTAGSDLSLTALGSIDLSGFTTVSTPPSGGHLLLIAGSDIHIGADAQVLANGTTTPQTSLTLVVDAKYPILPQIGPGQFLLDAGATLQAGAFPSVPVRIFTARQSQNVIQANINTVAYVAGQEFIDTPTELWGVYFPNPFYGGTGFTLFYKNLPVPPPPPQPIVNPTQAAVARTQMASFVNGEGFYDWSELDQYTFNDTFDFTTFTVSLAAHGETRQQGKILTSYDAVDDKGLCIRRRKLVREQVKRK